MSKMIPAGIVTAYGAAVRGGYLGTYEEFCTALGDLARVLEDFEGFSVSVTTLEPGESATADYSDGVLTLGIPAGETGNGIASAELNQNYTLTLTWTNGESTTVGPIRGATGQTPNLTVGTVETLDPDESATATITGTPEDPVLNLGIPKGESGGGDAGDITFDPEEDYDEGTVGAELSSQKNAIDQKAPLIINTASGELVHITDGADNLQIKKIVGTIEAVQSGSGTPSSENIRPITGWSAAKLYHGAKNLLDISNGTDIQTHWRKPYQSRVYNLSDFPEGKAATLSVNVTASLGTQSGRRLYIEGVDNATFINTGFAGRNSLTRTTNATGKLGVGQNDGALNSEDYAKALTQMQLEVSPVMTAFETPHGVTTHNIAFTDTVYGGYFAINADGSVDLVTTKGNIASYDGETLPGAWISDRDEYAVGATPTTGAQVVYELAEPVTTRLANTVVINTYKGVNNLWLDTGSISECVYAADTKLYVDGITATSLAEALNAINT